MVTRKSARNWHTSVTHFASSSFGFQTRAGGSRVTHAPRIRQALVVCQVALTVMLVYAGNLFGPPPPR